MIKNIIFDIDGTLWNSTEVVAEGWRRAVKETGYSNCEITGERLKGEFGLPMNIIADHVFSDLKDEDKKAELLKLCCKYEHELLEANEKDISYPGIVDEIKKLANGYKLFIVSNCQKGYIELVMDKLDVKEFIGDYLCFGDTGLTKGETMQKLMEKNGLDPKETVYVGDTAGDKEATEFAGATFVYAAYGFGNLEGEKFVAGQPCEISEVLSKMNEEKKTRTSVNPVFLILTIVFGSLLVLSFLGFACFAYYAGLRYTRNEKELKAYYEEKIQERDDTYNYALDRVEREKDDLKAEIEIAAQENAQQNDELKITQENLDKLEALLDEYNATIEAENKAEEERIANLSEEEAKAESDVKEYNEMVRELRDTNEEYEELYVALVKYLAKDSYTDKERKDIIKKYEKMLSIQKDYKKAKEEEKQKEEEEKKEEDPEANSDGEKEDKENKDGKNKTGSKHRTVAIVKSKDYALTEDLYDEDATVPGEVSLKIFYLYQTQKEKDAKITAQNSAPAGNGAGNNAGNNAGSGSAGAGNSGSGSNNSGSNSDWENWSWAPAAEVDTSGYAAAVVDLVNQQRAAAGLGSLTATSELNAAATKRAQEIISTFSHSRPDGSSCFTVLGDYGIAYMACGENIAAGQSTPESVMNSWMNSDGHRANILSGDYSHIGVGFVKSDSGYGYYWVQLFTN